MAVAAAGYWHYWDLRAGIHLVTYTSRIFSTSRFNWSLCFSDDSF